MLPLAFAIGWSLNPKPKYVYAVRENVNFTDKFSEWDLWCWKEMPNHKINKSYLGHFKIYDSTIGERVETTLCIKK